MCACKPELKQLNISSELIKIFIVEGLRGKGFHRTMVNYFLSQQSLTGEILDLGSSLPGASYHRFIQYIEPFKVTCTDLYHEGPDLLKLDLEQTFPISSNKYDAVLCVNVLEHIYNHKNLINEAYRVLKPGGIFVGSVPFLIHYHPDPHDYFRYTHETLWRLFSECNFQNISIHNLGFGPYLAGYLQRSHLFPSWISLPLSLYHLAKDLLLMPFIKKHKYKYPVRYAFIMQKIPADGQG
jgi:SAM-dependent methyltransferase